MNKKNKIVFLCLLTLILIVCGVTLFLIFSPKVTTVDDEFIAFTINDNGEMQKVDEVTINADFSRKRFGKDTSYIFNGKIVVNDYVIEKAIESHNLESFDQNGEYSLLIYHPFVEEEDGSISQYIDYSYCIYTLKDNFSNFYIEVYSKDAGLPIIKLICGKEEDSAKEFYIELSSVNPYM